jgi:hypothetical protein
MAQKKEINEQQNVEGSVQQSHDFTTGRAEKEERLASGNRRDGNVATEDEVNQSASEQE